MRSLIRGLALVLFGAVLRDLYIVWLEIVDEDHRW